MCYYYDRRDTDERCLPPLTSEITPSSFGEELDGVISYFYRKLLSLVVLAKNNNKCNGLYDNQCEIKQVFISNHFTTPFVLNFWGSVRGEAPSAVVVSLPGLVTVFRIPYSGTIRNLFIRKNNKIHLAKMRWM